MQKDAPSASRWVDHETEYLRASFEFAPAGVAVFDAQGRVLHANDIFLEMFGRPPQDLGAQADAHMGRPEDLAFSVEVHERMNSGDLDHCAFEKYYVRGDGSGIWTHVDVSRVKGPGEVGQFFVVHVRDITQRKQAEEEFRMGAHRFREAFRNAPVGMVLRSLHDRTVWVNRAIQEMLGYSEEEYRDATPTDRVHPDDVAKLTTDVPALLAGSVDGVLHDLRLIHKDGRILHGQVHLSVVRNADGEPEYTISQVVDITARKRAERQLQQRAEFDRVVTALATNFINLPLDRLDQGIERALEQVARFVGANRAAVVFYRDDEGELVGLQHEWAAPGLGSLRGIAGIHIWKFMAQSLAAGNTVFENDLVEEPPVRDATRDYLVEQGVRSFVAVPFVGSREAGIIGFASSEPTVWDVERLALLRIGAEMISNVLERRVADRMLRENSERLRQMADNVRTLFWVCRADNQELVYASKGLSEIYGVDFGSDVEEQGARIRTERLIHEEDFPAVVAGFLRGCKEPCSYEYRIRKPNGELAWLRTRCFPVPDPSGEAAHVAGVTDDISDEKKVAEETAYHARFEHLISELAMGFIDAPVAETDAGIDRALRIVGEFTNVDIAYCLLLGSDQRTVQEICGWTSALGEPYRGRLDEISLESFPWTLGHMLRGEMMHIADIEELPAAAAAERAAGVAVNLRTAVTYPLTDSGNLVGVLGFSSLETPKEWSEAALGTGQVVATMFSSVLARRRADRDLARRVEFERLIGRLAVDLVNLSDAELDDGLVGALRELAAFTGFHTVSIFQIDPDGTTISRTHEWTSRPSKERSEALRAISLSEMRWTANRLTARSAIQVIRVGELPEEAAGERELLQRIGVRLALRVAMFSSNGPRGFVSFSTGTEKADLSEDTYPLLRIAAELLSNALERRRAEREVHEHQAELAHALRLGTMGELAPWLAHELNQPLSAISSFARGCQRRLEAGNVDIQELTEVTEQMSRQAMRAGEVVQSLRRYVRKHEPRREWHRINDLVLSALAILRSEAMELSVDMHTNLDSEPAWVQVDPIQVEQVILNLVRNGFDAIAAGDGAAKVVTVATRCANGNVAVSVADTGVGLDSGPESIDPFEAFSGTKPSGLGLGLSLSRSIVEAHGGRIRAEANPHGGALFTFTLPRTRGPREELR